MKIISSFIQKTPWSCGRKKVNNEEIIENILYILTLNIKIISYNMYYQERMGSVRIYTVPKCIVKLLSFPANTWT